MKPNIADILSSLRDQFRDQLAERMLIIRQHFDAVSPEDWQLEKVESLHRLLHGLTGAAGTFGMPSLSDAARAIEQQLKLLVSSAYPPSSEIWQGIRANLDQLERLSQVKLTHPQFGAPAFYELPKSYSRPVIYIVEDDPNQAACLSEILQSENYIVRIFHDLTSFHEAVATESCPSAVLLDMVFPEGDDAGAKELLRLREEMQNCFPVIFTSVRDDIQARLAAYRAGATRYLVKPVDPEKLLWMVRSLTDTSPSQAYRVLLVDDDPLLLASHSAILQEAGMVVYGVVDPLKTLDAIHEFQPDLLVVDVYMPGISGPELVAILREDEQFALLPILFLSAEQNISSQLTALNLGGDDFLVKPVQASHLISAIIARASRARQQAATVKALRHSLYEREREHLALNEHSIVSIADAKGIITYVNDTFCKVSGYHRDELLGKTHSIIKSGCHTDDFYRDMWRTVSSGEIWHGEVCNKTKAGSFYWVKSTITPFLDAENQPYQYISIRTDITQMKAQEVQLIEARQQAESANVAKSAFLSNMSHELRTPLNAIIGFTQLLELDFDPETQAEHLDSLHEISKASHHLLALISDILDVAKIESANVQLHFEAVDVAKLFEDCLSMMQAYADKHQVSMVSTDCFLLHHQNGLAPIQVFADARRLKQVLLNLLSNAIKYNRTHGEVTLHCDFVEGDVLISVTDTGIGMTEVQLKQLFQPFNRLSQENSGIEGTGIGLNITKKLVELMKGSMGVESTPDVGSTFWLRMPALS